MYSLMVKRVASCGLLAVGAAPIPCAGAGAVERGGLGLFTEDDAVRILRELHPDFADYVHEMRLVTTQAARASTEALYSGVVRIGGVEPRLKEDAPDSGKGVRNDIILFPAALDPTRSPGWRQLLLDHEYFHARHLAHGWKVPVVDFGSSEVNSNYYEATAWSYVVRRARLGTYDQLSRGDLREAQATYTRHYQAIRKTIMDLQPSAWAHYRRFLVDPKGKAPTGARLAPIEP